MGTSRLALGLGALALLGLAAALAFGGGRGGAGASSPRPRDLPEDSPQEALTLVGLPSATAGAETTDARADADESEPDEEPEAEPTEPVPDPIQVGPCRLALELVDDTAAAAPVETGIQLWRIDAPGNTGWMHGDQLQASAEGGEDGLVTFEDLPEGRYRLFLRAVRHGADDPVEILVSPDGPVQRVVVPVARKFAVWLRVVDVEGRPRDVADVTFGGCASNHGGRDPYPTWRTPRLPIAGPPEPPSRTPSGGVTGCGNGKSYRMTATPAGFEFSGREVNRDCNSRLTMYVEVADACGTSLEILSPEEGPEGERTYVSVAVPEEPLAENVVLPDGRGALAAGASVRVRARATRALPEDPPDAWRRVPLEVTVTLDPYEQLRFETDLERGALQRTMKPFVPAETLDEPPLERLGGEPPAPPPPGR